MTDNTAAARKALLRLRQIKSGLARVEVIVPEDRKDEIKEIAHEMCLEHRIHKERAK